MTTADFQREIDQIVRRALDEDLPDITSEAIFEPGDRGQARFLMKASGILVGLAFAERTFAAIDPSAAFVAKRKDGDEVAAGDIVAEVSGSVVGLLAGERTALNLMQRASGIATTTRRYADAVRGTTAGIYATRKTAPRWRARAEFAVRCSGGHTRRAGAWYM